MNKAGEVFKMFAIIVCLALVAFGWGWCEWRGYKDRFPDGGCIGFVTSCSGDRK